MTCWFATARSSTKMMVSKLRSLSAKVWFCQLASKVARHPILSNADHGPLLPNSWRTLYELTQVDSRRPLSSIMPRKNGCRSTPESVGRPTENKPTDSNDRGSSRVRRQAMAKPTILTVEYLRERLRYDEHTGARLAENGRWNKSKKVGRVLKSKGRTWYISIYFAERQYLSHRLAWFYMTGEWPNGDLITSIRMASTIAGPICASALISKIRSIDLRKECT